MIQLPPRPGRRTERTPDGLRLIGWTAEEIADTAPPPTPAVADMLRRLFAARPADEAEADTTAYLDRQIGALQ